MNTIAETPVETAEPSPTSVERRIDLRGVPAEWLAWLGVLLALLALRLTGRTAWPLSPAESEVATDAWLFQQGSAVSDAADSHPLAAQLTALMFFLFGDTDYTARLVPLFAGIGIIATLFWMRRWIGNLPALSTAIVWTISPTMVLSSLRIDGGAILALSSLLILGTVFVMAVEPGPGKPIVLGISLAAAATAHPIGWLIAVFTVVPAMLLIRKPGLTGHLTRLSVSFIAALLIVSTWFASRPSGLLDFPRDSLTALWNDHLASLGTDWSLTALLLIVDEPLLLFLAVVGLVMAFVRPSWSTSAHPALIISCAAWAIPLLMLGVLLDGKGPAIYTATLFPLTLVAGMGLSAILDGVTTGRSRGAASLLVWVLAAAGLFVALVRFTDQLIQGPGQEATTWAASAIALALLIILPVGYAVYRLTPGVASHLAPAILLVLATLLAVPALRGSILITQTGTDQTGEVLLAGATTPSVGELQARVSAYSRDVSMYDRDAQDPAGGHGLSIAVADELRDPLQWYFRDFPELVIVSGPEGIDESSRPDMVFVDEANRDAFLANLDGYGSRAYPNRFELAMNEGRPAHTSLLAEAMNPLAFGSLVDFVLRRNGAPLLEYERLTLLIQEGHVDAFWGGLAE